MAILSKDEATQILKKVVSFSKADGIEATLNGNDGGNIRYALMDRGRQVSACPTSIRCSAWVGVRGARSSSCSVSTTLLSVANSARPSSCGQSKDAVRRSMGGACADSMSQRAVAWALSPRSTVSVCVIRI